MRWSMGILFLCFFAVLGYWQKAQSADDHGIAASSAKPYGEDGLILFVPLGEKPFATPRAKIQVVLSPSWRKVLTVEDAELLEGPPDGSPDSEKKLAATQPYFYAEAPSDTAGQFLLVDLDTSAPYTFAVYVKGIDPFELDAAKKALPKSPREFQIRIISPSNR